MRIHGFEINTEEIASGLFLLICESGDTAPLAFGMIPNWVHESLERNLREVIFERHAKYLHVSVEEAKKFTDEKKMREILNRVSKEVAVNILKQGKLAGMVVV